MLPRRAETLHTIKSIPGYPAPRWGKADAVVYAQHLSQVTDCDHKTVRVDKECPMRVSRNFTYICVSLSPDTFFSAMVSCRYWHMCETVGMRKRSVFKIGGCVHSLIVLGFVGRCFHTFLSLKHFPTRIYWSIASIAAWGHLLFFYLRRTLLRN